MIDFLKIIERIKTMKCITTDAQVADMFGLSPQDFNRRKKQGTLLSLVVEFGINEKVDLDWLITGEERPYINMNSFNDSSFPPSISKQDKNYSIVDLKHSDVIKQFIDKSFARDVSLDLVKIEKLDPTEFREIGFYVKGIARGLEKLAGAYSGTERRQADRRTVKDIELSPKQDRRSGMDRRKAGAKR